MGKLLSCHNKKHPELSRMPVGRISRRRRFKRACTLALSVMGRAAAHRRLMKIFPMAATFF